MSNSPPSFLMWSMSPTRTSREGLAAVLFEVMRFMSQALEACSRVLKKRAAQSHLSMRVPVMLLFSYTARLYRAEDADGEIEESAYEFKGASDDDAHETEGQEYQPDQWIEEECGESERPADDKED